MTFCVQGLEDGIVTTSVLPKVTYKLSAIPIKLPVTFFLLQTEKFMLNFIWTLKEPLNNQPNPY